MLEAGAISLFVDLFCFGWAQSLLLFISFVKGDDG